jgi:hypothetical protein
VLVSGRHSQDHWASKAFVQGVIKRTAELGSVIGHIHVTQDAMLLNVMVLETIDISVVGISIPITIVGWCGKDKCVSIQNYDILQGDVQLQI